MTVRSWVVLLRHFLDFVSAPVALIVSLKTCGMKVVMIPQRNSWKEYSIMELPKYYSMRPAIELDAGTVASFERLFAEAVDHGTGAEIDYKLQVPKWQFLCYLCDTKGIVMHD